MDPFLKGLLAGQETPQRGLLGQSFQHMTVKRQDSSSMPPPTGLLSAIADPEFWKRDIPNSAKEYFSSPENSLRALSVVPIPMLSDLAGVSADALMYANKPEERTPLNFGLTGLGLLPFIPAAAGMIKSSGNIPKAGLPPEIDSQVVRPTIGSLPKSDAYDAAGNVYQDMNVKLSKLNTGDFLGTYRPAWLQGGKERYAVGDNAQELIDALLDTSKRSRAGVAAAETNKFNKSLVGQLSKLGFNPADFKESSSARSVSTYLVHGPSGTKIRISDHDLPLGYEQPDVDLRTWMTDEEKIKAINAALR